MDTKKILIIGAFTNGEAAKDEFAIRQYWGATEVEYCGSNGRVVARLTHGPALAVVPIYNSIVGEITEVTHAIEAARASGYTFSEVDRIDLPINQCLMSPRYVTQASEMKQVFSHREALRQCRGYLTALGISREHRFECPSTGAAAEAVARLHADDDEHFVAAIAPRAAAAHYGLRLLAENIQDDPKAFTTFILIKHAGPDDA